MKTERKIFCIVALAVALYLDVAYIIHLRQVICDQQVYIDAGARGRYQGEE